MKTLMKVHRNSKEKGVALLIAMFALLLISGLALALVYMASNETFIANNFKSNSKAFYAAYDGIEEGRGRLSTGHPQSLGPLIAGLPGGVLLPGSAIYIVNPAPAEAVNPTNLAPANPYRDTEYQQEWPLPLPPVPIVVGGFQNSTFVLAGGLPGPLFKWVRITAKTEQSANTDVSGDGLIDLVTPVFFDGTNQYIGPGNFEVNPVNLKNGQQVFVVTSLAVLPNGSRRLVQYEAAPLISKLAFPSPLTLMASQVNMQGANSSPYHIYGQDRVSGGNCASPPLPTAPAIGVTGTNAADVTTNISSVCGAACGGSGGIPNNRSGNYTGAPPPNGAQYNAVPSIGDVTTQLNRDTLTPATLDNVVQDVTSNADLVINGNATQADMPPQMSALNPMTVVVNGDFTMSGSYTGYGLLVVTGNFTYSGSDGWKGVVMIVGTGTTTFLGNGGGNNEFDGAVLVAATKDQGGNLLPTLGTVNFDISGGGGNGIYYNSCWINRATRNIASYAAIAFREITQ